MKKFLKVLRKVAAITGWSIAGGVILLCLSVFAFDFYSAMTKKYWIDASKNTYYTDSYEEKGGCVYFTNEYNSPIKQCGSYRISDQSK